MIEFTLLKKSNKSSARLGVLKTPHGEVETPAFVPVGTQAVVKTLDSQDVINTRTQILIANTYHLHVRPGEEIISAAGGLQQFMALNKPFMTDSGGFQVFSLGFGRDLQVGKLIKYLPGEFNPEDVVHKDASPKYMRITDDGVWFQSYTDGRELFLGPKESIAIQEKLGADIILVFDECTPPTATREYIESSLEKTKRWARVCREVKKSDQALYGIVQGSHYQDLRVDHATYTNNLGFDGFAIGGDLGDGKETMEKILQWTIPFLDEKKPRHLLGIGHPEDFEIAGRNGMDTFDCIAPTHYARRGTAFTHAGKINLRSRQFEKEREPIDALCDCYVCQTYKRDYITHLILASEITGLKLITMHNLYFFNKLAEKLREKIKNDEL